MTHDNQRSNAKKDVSLEGGLEAKLKTDNSSSSSPARAVIADTAGNITYSLIVGSILDYYSGLNLSGIIASRLSGTAINSITGSPYGWWREKTFSLTHTADDSGKVRKTLVDLLAFNTFQVPFYAVAVSIGSLVSEGTIDCEKVQNGSLYLASISPLIGPTMGMYLDLCRRFLGVKSAAQGAYMNTPEK